jgi:hypothetical protein
LKNLSKYLFLFKENNTQDRDCVKYIRVRDLEENHLCIDGKFNVHGASFSMSLKDEYDFNDIETILTKEEFLALCNPKKHFDFTEIIGKLKSDENNRLFEHIIVDEKEFIEHQYNIDNEDVEYIFNNYGLNYQDRGVIGHIFDDIEEASQEEAEQLGFVNESNRKYFDYEKFGEDLLQGEQYLELPSGKIVYLNY